MEKHKTPTFTYHMPDRGSLEVELDIPSLTDLKVAQHLMFYANEVAFSACRLHAEHRSIRLMNALYHEYHIVRRLEITSVTKKG